MKWKRGALFGTTAAKDESGQSLVEFVLLFPMLAGLVLLLVRVNTAIQISIVNQQYSRAQAHFLTFNSPHYPQRIPNDMQQHLINGKSNRMVLGVSDNNNPDEQASDDYIPRATEQPIARTRAKAGSKGEPGKFPDNKKQGWVRIFNTVALCTQLNVMKVQGQYKDLDLTKNPSPSSFDYCRSPLDEVL